MRIGAVLLLLAFVMLSAKCDPNPGFVMDFRRQIFLDVIDRYFLEVLESYGQIEIPYMEMEGITLTNLTVNVTNPSAQNVQFDFNSTQNALIAGVSNTSIYISLKWKYNALLSGNALISGPVKVAGLNVGFTETQRDEFNVPQLSLNHFDFALDKDAFKLNFDCKLCPKFLTDLLVKIFKSSLLSTVENSVREMFSQELFEDMNAGIYEFYPTTVNVTDEIGVSTALVSSINVEDDHLELPLDMTFFLLSEGYKRQGDGPVVPRYDAQDSGEIMVFLSSYVTDTLMRTINTKPISFPFKVLLFNMKLHLLGPSSPTIIKMKKNNLQITASPALDVGFLRITYSVSFEAKLDASVKTGDGDVMLYITPQLRGLSLKKFQMTFIGIKFDLTFARIILNWIVGLVANWVLIPTFEVPQLPGLPLKATNSLLNVRDNFVEFGISFAFNHLRKYIQ